MHLGMIPFTKKTWPMALLESCMFSIFIPVEYSFDNNNPKSLRILAALLWLPWIATIGALAAVFFCILGIPLCIIQIIID